MLAKRVPVVRNWHGRPDLFGYPAHLLQPLPACHVRCLSVADMKTDQVVHVAQVQIVGPSNGSQCSFTLNHE